MTDTPTPIQCSGPADVAHQLFCMPPDKLARNLAIIFRGLVEHRQYHGDSRDDACEIAAGYLDGIVEELHGLHEQEYQ